MRTPSCAALDGKEGAVPVAVSLIFPDSRELRYQPRPTSCWFRRLAIAGVTPSIWWQPISSVDARDPMTASALHSVWPTLNLHYAVRRGCAVNNAIRLQAATRSARCAFCIKALDGMSKPREIRADPFSESPIIPTKPSNLLELLRDGSPQGEVDDKSRR